MAELNVKSIFNDYFREHKYLYSQHVELRPYNLDTDSIIGSFSDCDWEEIFPGIDEASFNIWSKCGDRIILSCIDKELQQLFGVLVITDSIRSENSVCFHGGTWKHERRYSLLAYEGLHKVLQLLLANRFEVLTTCNKTNLRADMLQKRFGFVEYKIDDYLSYKYLDVDRFKKSDIPICLDRCFLNESK